MHKILKLLRRWAMRFYSVPSTYEYADSQYDRAVGSTSTRPRTSTSVTEYDSYYDS